MKGIVIRNCGLAGLDWERLSLSGYVEAMQAEDPGDGEPDTSRLRRFMATKGA